MSNWQSSPALYEINTRVWLDELSRAAGSRVTLGGVPQAELERLADYGFDALWLMGVWERGPAGRRVSREDPALAASYRSLLPDYRPEDAAGSPYAIYRYQVDPALGGEEELAALRERLRSLRLRLVLDFVPNHLAVDHEWLAKHPQRLLRGDRTSLIKDPKNYFSPADGRARVFAHGRDPGYDGWSDTVQLDYRRRETREAMTAVLRSIASRCDGVRCDMAMLVTHDIFLQTWGGSFDPPGTEFWPEAIAAAKRTNPNFLLLAEVYWDKEYLLQQQGFDYTYDKRLYDRLLKDTPESVRAHLTADIEFQSRLVRFIENHDEERAATAFGPARSRAAAALTLTLPGLRLFHEGQLEGRRLKLPVQLARRPPEAADPATEQFYRLLLDSLRHPVFHLGEWRQIEPREAWAGNTSYKSFVAHLWVAGDERRLVVVNLSPDAAQCFLPLDIPTLAGNSCELSDLLGDAKYIRDGDELLSRGLYLDVPGHAHHLFELRITDTIPPGINPYRVLRGHEGAIYGVVWSPDGRTLASASADKSIRFWDVESGALVREIKGRGEVGECAAWSPDGKVLATGSSDNHVRLWDAADGSLIRKLAGHSDNVLSLSWSPGGDVLASGSIDRTVKLWNPQTGELLDTIEGQTDAINCVAWSPDGMILASGSGDKTVQLQDARTRKLLRKINEQEWVSTVAWSPDGKLLAAGTGRGTVGVWSAVTGRQVAVLEGHTERVLCVAFDSAGQLLASKSADNTVSFWRRDNWKALASLKGEHGEYLTGLAFHPRFPVVATRDDKKNEIRVWTLDADTLQHTKPDSPSVQYTNAKVVLVGETGAGKTCLARALRGLPYEPQTSTHGRQVWALSTDTVERPGHGAVIRETFLWDLAGQPDYRLIHQLSLTEVAVALIVFDSRGHAEPFVAVRHWDRALRQAQHAQGGAALPMKKLLVASRTDVGRIGVSRAQIDALMQDLQFDGYFETSACEGRGVAELEAAIREGINWEALPVVSSTELILKIKGFLLSEKEAGVLLATEEALYRAFLRSAEAPPESEELRAQFKTCIGLVESRGLIQRLGFGGQVLLRPELRDVYASAVVNEARDEPDGLGCIGEGKVLAGDFRLPEGERIRDKGQELLLMHSIIGSLISHEIALREESSHGDYLVFPAQFTRESPNLPDAEGKAVVLSFEGAVFNVYATLAVRLSHSGFFKKKEMWKNAATYTAMVGGTCGMSLREVEEGRGELTLFFDAAATAETRYTFEEFIRAHLLKRALPDSLKRRRVFICPECKTPVSDLAVERRKAAGLDWIICSACVCDPPTRISLLEHEERPVKDSSSVDEIIVRTNDKCRQETLRARLAAKRAVGDYDIFFSYNRDDRAAVELIAKQLEEQEYVLPWVDVLDSKPANFVAKIQSQIEKAKAAAIFFGRSGLGPWQEMEYYALINESAKRQLPVIPVILPDCEADPKLPVLLQMRDWVDFREPNSCPVERLRRAALLE